MQLEFVPIEEFYFALTLAVRPLEELEAAGIVQQIYPLLMEKCGQPSTVAAAKQNTFNYVFRVHGYADSFPDTIVVSVADWQDKIRLGSNYGLVLDKDRKAVRTEHFNQRTEFAYKVRSHLQEWLGLHLI